MLDIKVGKPSIDATSQWAYGEPIENGLVYTEGDSTVSLYSSQNVLSDEQIEINSSHMKLPGNAQNIVYKTLTGNFPQKDAPIFEIDKQLFFFVLSPIDSQIIAPDGVHWIGKNIKGLLDNQIEGAFYTGYETDSEFVTIPNPEDGEYTVVTEGTGSGEYTVEVASISEDDNSGQATESMAEIKGMAVKDEIKESVATVSEEGVTAENVDVEIPTVTIDIETISKNIKHYYSLGLISKKSTEIMLEARLKNIKMMMEFTDTFESRWRMWRGCKRVVENLERNINRQIDSLEKQIQNNRNLKKTIDPEVRVILVEDLEAIKFL